MDMIPTSKKFLSQQMLKTLLVSVHPLFIIYLGKDIAFSLIN